MKVLLCIAGALLLIAFVYMGSSRRRNIVLNVLTFVLGILTPIIMISYVFLSPELKHVGDICKTIFLGWPWWAYAMTVLVDGFCACFLVYVSEEQMARALDDRIDVVLMCKSVGATFIVAVLTFVLLFPIVNLIV